MTILRTAFSNKKLWKESRRIFWFAALSTVLSTFNLFADEFIAGNLGADTIRAIAVVDFNLVFLNAIAGFLSVALRGHLAQSLTAKRNEHAQKTFDFSLALALLAAAFSLILMWLLKDALISWRTTNLDPVAKAEVVSQANVYWWFILGIRAFNMYSRRFNIFLSVKGYQGRMTFLGLLTICVNIVVSVILCYIYHFGIIGTAIGTATSIGFSFFVKSMLIFRMRKEFEISLAPWRFIFAKLGQFKVLKKTWMYLPYESVYFVMIMVQTWILGSYFQDGLLLISMSSSIAFAIVGVSGSGTLMTKMVSPLLGKGETDKAKQLTEQLLVISTIRSTVISLLYCSLFGLALPYIHLYDAPFAEVQKAGWIVFGYGMAAGIMAPSFYSGYNLASLSANPKRTIIIDLSMSAASIGVFFICQAISDSWVSLMMAQISFRVGADLVMVTNVFKKSQYISLKKEMA